MSINTPTADPAALLRGRLRLAFGIDRPAAKDTVPFALGTASVVFALTDTENRADNLWIILNTPYMGSTGSIANNIASHMGVSVATAALATRAVNNVPLWRFLGIKPAPETLAAIADPLFPPEPLRLQAAAMWLADWLMVGDDSLPSFLSDEHERLFSRTSKARAPSFDFRCTDCGYIASIPEADIDRFKKVIEESGGIHCSACSGSAMPPKDEELANPESPLARRFGSGSRPTTT